MWLQDVDNLFFGGVTNHHYYEVDAKDEPDLLQVHDGVLLQEALPSVHEVQQPAALDVVPLVPETSPGEVFPLRKMNAAMLIRTTDI